MMFFAQVDLGPVAAHLDLPLPDGGLLLVFCDYDTRGDGPGVMGMYAEDVDAVRVLHARPGAPLVRTGPPAPVELVTEALCVPLLTWTLPGAEGVLDAKDEDEAYDALDELDGVLRDLLDLAAPDGHALGGHHRLGGHARPVQRPVELDLVSSLGSHRDGSEVLVDADPAEWRLLFQVDEDEGLGIWFGDSGTLYWLAHRDDLAAGDLTRVRFVYQCM